MIRRHAVTLRTLLMVVDAAVAIGVVGLVYVLRFTTTSAPVGEASLSESWAALLLYSIVWVLLLYLSGEYRLRAHWTLRGEVVGIARATIWLALLSLSALFLWDLKEISRLFLLLLFPTQCLATIGTRMVLRWGFEYLRSHGRNVRNLLVLGTDPHAYEFARKIEEHSAFGLRVIGFLGDRPAVDPGRWPYLGPISSIAEVFHDRVVDEAAICLARSEWSELNDVVRLCQEEGKIVRIPLEAPDFETGLRIIEDLDGTAVLSLLQGPDHLLSLALKRMLDVLGASVALVILSPLLLGVALSIRWREESPVLFRQVRIGMHGRPFTILKFRTMVPDAEERFADVASLSETTGAAFKMTRDPRVTSWGGFLRRTSIDELPQLVNVLRGEMSLVGPRPAPQREVDAYDIWHRRRLSMKPGMTGLWQVSSRIDEDFDERARLDLDYIDRWSLWLDLRIVARTVPVVLHLQGR